MANKLLYPKNTETRRVMDLGGMWRFRLDENDEGISQNWKDGLIGSTLIHVPSSFNDLFTEKWIREFTGDIWYETDLYVPKEWSDMDLDLRFSGVTHHAAVYVNGVKIKEHAGGYTPFNASIQDVVSCNKKNKIVVCVSNELNEEMLPAGRVITLENGKRMAKSNTNFFNYAGIQRPVKLVATPKESIVDFSVTFELTESDAIVFYTVETTGDNQVTIEVYDQEHNLVAGSIGKENRIEIKDVQLWKPLAPYLYTFMIKIKENDKLVDMYHEEVGIGTVEVKGNQLLVNNEPVYLKGFAKQEDSDLRGAGFNLAYLKRDFELLKWSGANSLRTSNFPHCEELYQMADKEGIIVINEVPAVGFTDKNPYVRQMIARGDVESPFFSREHVQTVTLENHTDSLTELIERDKNYASVCIWSLLIEPDTDHDSIVPYVNQIFEKAHQLDRQKRPRTIVLSMSSTIDKTKVWEMCDIVSLNRFYGSNIMSGYELSDAEEALEEEISNWSKVNKPIVFTAFGVEALAGEIKLPSVQWSENYQIELLMMHHRIFDRYNCINGEIVWSFADFQTAEGLLSIDGNKSGMFTRNRQPKMPAYFLEQRWENKA